MIITITKNHRPTKTCKFRKRNSGLNFENYISYLSEKSWILLYHTELSNPPSLSNRTLKTSFYISQDSQNLIPYHTELLNPPSVSNRTLKTSFYISQDSQNLIPYHTELSNPPSVSNRTLKNSFHISQNSQNPIPYHTELSKPHFKSRRILNNSSKQSSNNVNCCALCDDGMYFDKWLASLKRSCCLHQVEVGIKL